MVRSLVELATTGCRFLAGLVCIQEALGLGVNFTFFMLPLSSLMEASSYWFTIARAFRSQ